MIRRIQQNLQKKQLIQQKKNVETNNHPLFKKDQLNQKKEKLNLMKNNQKKILILNAIVKEEANIQAEQDTEEQIQTPEEGRRRKYRRSNELTQEITEPKEKMIFKHQRKDLKKKLLRVLKKSEEPEEGLIKASEETQTHVEEEELLVEEPVEEIDIEEHAEQRPVKKKNKTKKRNLKLKRKLKKLLRKQAKRLLLKCLGSRRVSERPIYNKEKINHNSKTLKKQKVQLENHKNLKKNQNQQVSVSEVTMIDEETTVEKSRFGNELVPDDQQDEE